MDVNMFLILQSKIVQDINNLKNDYVREMKQKETRKLKELK